MTGGTDTRAAALEAIAAGRLDLGNPGPEDIRGADRFRHWRWHIDGDGYAWVIFDKENASTNTLCQDVMLELDGVMDSLEKDPPAGIILRSAKQNGFAAGAEIGDFEGMTDEPEIVSRIEIGLGFFERLARFPGPTVALVHGLCLGGGLELALACRHRIGRDDTSVGFPEILLGLHPGLAGTWRPLRHMEPVGAMKMMLTGRTMRAKQARKAGLLDAVVPERHMRAAAVRAITGAIGAARPGLRGALLSTAPARAVIAGTMRRQTAARVREEHYPAPYALIDLWRRFGGDSRAMQYEETKSFARLLTSGAARELIRVFHLRERLKQYGGDAGHDIRHVHVIGAGVMGGDIAAWCAARGFSVSIQDLETEYIAPAIKRAGSIFQREFGHEGRVRAALDRLMPDVNGYGLTRADLVIEAVPEDIGIKRRVHEAAESGMREDAILATNTSSILLERLSATLARPERFLGLHFFNPVPRMPLVEIVTHGVLDNGIRDRALSFTAAIGKLPLPVKSAPGFLVNRALTPYLVEALTCLDEGIRPEVIDEAALAFGMPTGPIELADRIGLDVCLHIARVLTRDLDHPFPDIPRWLEDKVARGDLGRKTGCGLYRYRKDRPRKRATGAAADPGLQDRLILPLLDSCAACLREIVVEGRDIADAGMIFGAGFAPFRGGPMRYAETRGLGDIVKSLESLEERYGPRFKPDRAWSKLLEY